jgi:hypothetical protein
MGTDMKKKGRDDHGISSEVFRNLQNFPGIRALFSLAISQDVTFMGKAMIRKAI